MNKINSIKFLIILLVSIVPALILPSQATARPDLVISHFSAPDSARAGQDIHGSFRLVVQNRGTETARNFNIDLVLSKDKYVPVQFATYSENFKEDALLAGGRSHIAELRPGQWADVSDTLSGTIPLKIWSGIYWLAIVVDPAGIVDESRENNNISIRQIKITGKEPRLVLSDKESPKANIDVEGILVFTVGDQIKIRASAEDNVKVAKTHVYIDGRLEKSCNTWECRYSGTLTRVGLHKCRAAAEDTSGNMGKSQILEFMVHPTAKPGPSLTSKIQPYHPASHEKIKFIAEARHSSGVENITILVNNRAVKTCNGDSCEYMGGPYNVGNIVWRVSAKSRDGGKIYGHDKVVTIRAAGVVGRTSPEHVTEGGTCSISGSISGVAILSSVILYGPDNMSLYRDSKKFTTPSTYKFSGLPKGRYKVLVDVIPDTMVGSNPRSTFVDCRDNAISGVDFVLR